jgi:glyoxylase-like metal-dependent hydrolase (beta-lactamase superfamily II)
MQLLWGEIEPTPQQRLHIVEHGDTLNIAGRRLQVFYTPGHAVHHVTFFDSASGAAFVGDTAGVRLQDVDYVRPPTPPPDIDLEAWADSMQLIKNLRPTVLYIAHFGPIREVDAHFERLHNQLFVWGDFVLKALRAGKDEAEIITMLIEHTQPELERVATSPRAIPRYEIATNYAMTVQGYMRYWRKKHPEWL